MKVALIRPYLCQDAWNDYEKAKKAFLSKKQK